MNNTNDHGRTFTDVEIALAARTAHEVNRAYCAGLGDHTQVRWEDAPEWQRLSALNGVRGVIKSNTPEQSHMSWLSEKDVEAKTHPCFVSYGELPAAQQYKDTLYVTTVRGVLGI